MDAHAGAAGLHCSCPPPHLFHPGCQLLHQAGQGEAGQEGASHAEGELSRCTGPGHPVLPAAASKALLLPAPPLHCFALPARGARCCRRAPPAAASAGEASPPRRSRLPPAPRPAPQVVVSNRREDARGGVRLFLELDAFLAGCNAWKPPRASGYRRVECRAHTFGHDFYADVGLMQDTDLLVRRGRGAGSGRRPAQAGRCLLPAPLGGCRAGAGR